MRDVGTFCTTGPAVYSAAIFGCCNLIMGNIRFGPTVIEELVATYKLPQWCTAEQLP